MGKPTRAEAAARPTAEAIIFVEIEDDQHQTFAAFDFDRANFQGDQWYQQTAQPRQNPESPFVLWIV